MKVAIGYCRISQKERNQSLYSLDGQKRRQQEYAQRNDIILEATFVDEQSGKSFKRKGWIALEKYIKRHRKRIDYVLVDMYDRFSRNAAESLVTLDKIENKWGIKVISINEDYGTNTDDPLSFDYRAGKMIRAHTERLIIADRTKKSMREAAKQGRYVYSNTPYGYDKVYFETCGKKKKFNLIVNAHHAEIHRDIVKKLLEGVLTRVQIREQMRKRGFPHTGNDAIKRAVTNPVAYGYVPVPSYRNEPFYLGDSMYEAIHPKSSYEIVKGLFEKTTYKLNLSVVSEDFYLRGIVRCKTCNHFLTGAKSKGKKNYYPYYKCNSCKGSNVNANKAHELLENVLSSLELPENVLRYQKELLEEQFKKRVKHTATRVTMLKREVNELEKRLQSLDEKFIDDKISESVYNHNRTRWDRELTDKREELQTASKGIAKKRKLVNAGFPLLGMLNKIFAKATAEHKQKLVKAIFPHDLILEKCGYRTPAINDIFCCNSLNINGLEVEKEKGFASKNDTKPRCSPTGKRIEQEKNQLDHLLRALISVNAA